MDAFRLTSALSQIVDSKLAGELVSEFIKIRQDLATKTLERASLGKFVETFVQCLQHIARGKYDTSPSVDHYLDKKAENETKPPDGLRICSARIARSIYTLRNKRNILHKGQVDANTIDLAFAHHASAWIMSELLRNATGVSMQEAGELIELVHAPVGSLVEEIDGVPLVLPDVSARFELLILLHNRYRSSLPISEAFKSLSRRSNQTVRNELNKLYQKKFVQGSAKDGYRLTRKGFDRALVEIRRLAQ